jgi:hypothetical protein
MTSTMMKLPLAAVAFAASACAHPASTAPPPQSAKDAREPASVAIEYEVTRKGADEGVVLRGRTTVDGRHEPGVEHNAHDREELRFATRERNDGSFDLEMKYRETTPDGTTIRWEPVLRVARGGTANADVSGAGWSREVRVKVD